MATLRSALRGTPPTYALPPVPPPPPSEYDISSPALRSRFSAETLMIKPSPSKTLKSFFSVSSSADGSAPASSSTVTTTKRYHRRLSATQAARAAREAGEGSPPRLGHFPSASESRLNLGTTRPSDSTSDRQPSLPPEQARRGSFAGVGRSRSRSRSRPSLRGRRTSSSNGNGGTGIGALDAAADKLAGVAREALGKLTTSGRHRAPRQQSSETSTARHSFASASTSASASASASAPPPLPTTRVGPCHVQEPTQHVRELSARSAATDSSTTLSASSVHRRGRGRPLPELAATRPRPKHLPANPRPAAPPSPTIPPLNYTSHTTTTTTNNPNFRAHAVRVPSFEILRSHDSHCLFVRLDVGGQSRYMTTVATLLEAEDAGGKLGEFVAALFLEEGSTASGSALAPIDDEPERPPSQHATSSQPAVPPPPPPPPSPFPFAADEISLFDHGSSSSISFFDDLTASPSSIDPLVHTTLIGEHFSFSFPPLGDSPSPTTPTLKVSPSQNAQRVFSLVPSPTSASGIRKHTSVYPDFGPSRASVVAVKADEEAPFPAMVFVELDLPPLQMASSSPSCSSSSSFSGGSESPSPSSASSSEPESFIDFGGPGDTPKRPHFEVMREQLFRRQADDAQDRSSLALAPEGGALVRQSLTYGEVQPPEDQMSTVEAFTSPTFECAASSRVHSHAFFCREMESAQLCSDAIKPETPRLRVAEARQQRLYSSARRSTLLADRIIDIFLDRTDFPISSPHHLAESGAGEVATVYSALLAFLRGGAFPAVLSIPEFDPTMPVYGASDSLRPGSTAVLSCLTTFNMIKDEARWLGLQAAERACDRYIQHLCRLVSAGSGGGSAANRDGRQMQGEKAQGREGWI